MVSAYLLACFVVGLAGAWGIARYGKGLGLIDYPIERSSHRVPLPKGGGLGILATLVLSSLIWEMPRFLWMPACVVSCVSLLGDYSELSLKIRLTVHIGAATTFMVYAASRTDSLSEFGWGAAFLVGIGVLFISATLNIYNFMDGINGIAGLSGAIAFSLAGIFSLAQGRVLSMTMPAFGIMAACIGFLPMNFPKARVFMGDVGSVLLGFLFSSYVLWLSRSILDVVVLTSFIFPFYADEFNTILARVRDRQKLTRAHRRHIYQILANQRGLSHSRVTLYYAGLQVLVGVSTWVMMRWGLLVVIAFLFMCYGGSFLWGMRVRRMWEATGLESQYGAG